MFTEIINLLYIDLYLSQFELRDYNLLIQVQ
jgi:hypothetical protein